MCAKMIPPEIGFYDSRSHEDEVFNSLKNNLDDSYTVFHSRFKISYDGNHKQEHENDFIIFHPQKGILVIEVKHGNISLENGQWIQSWVNRDGSHGQKTIDPYGQARRGAYDILGEIRKLQRTYRNINCKCVYAAWFLSISQKTIDRIRDWPDEASSRITLTLDDLKNPSPKIEKIFSEIPNGYTGNTNLSKEDYRLIMEKVLCTPLHLVAKEDYWRNHSQEVEFAQLLDDQYAVLEFLEEQKTVAISGSAGTGKTLVAKEKAKRLAKQGEKVLFLCFNSKLQQHLSNSNEYKENIHYMTINGYIAYLTNGSVNNYNSAIEKLESIYMSGNSEKFGYNSIIIDEAQDFGALRIRGDNRKYGSEILEWLYNIVDDLLDGCFYIFYDELQLLNGSVELPDFIRKAECKITLHKNCRNTTNIAKTSMHPMINSFLHMDGITSTEQKKLKKRRTNIKGVSEGRISVIEYSTAENERKLIDEIVNEYLSKGIRQEDIVILTCLPEDAGNYSTIYQNEISTEKYKTKNNIEISFSNCNKFKGMESDCIILIEVSRDTFRNAKATMGYYVGISRAKKDLTIVARCTEEECKDLAENCFDEDELLYNNYQEQLASILCCRKR